MRLCFVPKYACFEQLPYPFQSLQTLTITVKPRFTEAPTLYSGNSLLRKICFVPGERKLLHFLHFNPLLADTTLIHMATFYGPLSVWIDPV